LKVAAPATEAHKGSEWTFSLIDNAVVLRNTSFMPIPKLRQTRRAREIERTRQDILEAAARVFAKAGFHAATMQAIARETGYTAASLYTYFKSKEAIYEDLCDDIKSRLLANWEHHLPAGLTFAQRLELLLQRQLSLVAERRDALRVILDVGSPRSDRCETHAALLEPLVRIFAEAGEGFFRISAKEAANILFGIANAVVVSWILGDEKPDPPRHAARIIDLFLHGVAAPQRA